MSYDYTASHLLSLICMNVKEFDIYTIGGPII